MRNIKFIIIFSVLFFGGLFFGARQAYAYNNAEYISQSNVPASMTTNQTTNVSVTMKNTGDQNWTKGQRHLLGSQNWQDNLTWGLNRVELENSSTTHPGDSYTFTFNITAPSTPGTYNFRWRMVQEGEEWFGQYTPNVAINVSVASLTCTSTSPNGSTFYGNTTQRIYAYGVANTGSMFFPTWSANGTVVPDGRDDIIWYNGINDGGGTWHVDVNYANHVNIPNSPGYGMVYTDIYMYRNSDHTPIPAIYCGPAHNTTVPPLAVSISASPTSIAYNAQSTITWSSTSASSCTVTPGGWTGTSSSHSTGALTTTTTYSLSCNGVAGGNMGATATVTVAGVPTATISASPSSISWNASSTITWSSTGVSACTVTPGSWIGTSGSHSTGNLTTTTVYTINCDNGAATKTVTVTVGVAPPQPACTSSGPAGAIEPSSSTSHAVSAYGVANANVVRFSAWLGAMTPLWYTVSSGSGGTWSATINPQSFAGLGLVNVNVYVGSAYYSDILCGTANFSKVQAGTINIDIPAGKNWTLTGPATWISSQNPLTGTGPKTGASALSNFPYGVYTLTPEGQSGYTVTVSPASNQELK